MNALPPTQPTTKSGIDAGLAFHQPMLASPDPQAMLPSERIAATMGDRNLTPKQFGALGEQYAAAWLEEHGWTTLSRNWHTRYGELDIVMLNPEYTVVFVEVKSRRSMHYGYPQEAITPAKQHNLRKAACDWLLDRRNRVPHWIAGCIVVRSPRAREISVSSHWIRLAANPCDREHEPCGHAQTRFVA